MARNALLVKFRPISAPPMPAALAACFGVEAKPNRSGASSPASPDRRSGPPLSPTGRGIPTAPVSPMSSGRAASRSPRASPPIETPESPPQLPPLRLGKSLEAAAGTATPKSEVDSPVAAPVGRYSIRLPDFYVPGEGGRGRGRRRAGEGSAEKIAAIEHAWAAAVAAGGGGGSGKESWLGPESFVSVCKDLVSRRKLCKMRSLSLRRSWHSKRTHYSLAGWFPVLCGKTADATNQPALSWGE